MNRIKKILFVLGGLIAILAISLFAFKYIRASKADKFKIPQESASVIYLGVDDMAMDLLINSLSNYNAYYGKSSTDTDSIKRKKVWNIGVQIPAKLYLFNLSDISYTFYTFLAISDRAKLEKFLAEDMGMQVDSTFLNSDNSFKGFVKKKVQVILGEEKMLVGIGPKSDSKTLIGLMQSEQDGWTLAKDRLKEVPEIASSNFAYVDRQKNWGKLDFGNGTIAIDGRVKSPLFKFPSNPVGMDVADNQVMSLLFNSDLSLLVKHKESELEKLNLPIDSAYKYVGNFMSLQIADKPVLESDTIITYDYDDNFEMVEKKEVQEIEVPDLRFNIMASPHLIGYLPEKMFYKFSKNYDKGLIQLSTNKTSTSLPVLKPSTHVFSFNYKQHPSALGILGWLPNIDQIGTVKIEGNAKGQDEMLLTGEVLLNEKELNSFYQIFIN